MLSYGAEYTLGSSKYDSKNGVSLELFESIYGESRYAITLNHSDKIEANKIIESIENKPSSVRWGVFDSEKIEWSEPRKVEIRGLNIQFNNAGIYITVDATDKLYFMRHQGQGKTWKKKTVKQVLEELAKDYELTIAEGCDANSKPQDFLECHDSDYDFIRYVLLPRAREYLISQGNSVCDFMFYTDKGTELVVKTRQPSKKKPLEFSYEVKDGTIWIGDFISSVEVGRDQFHVQGVGVDYVTNPFLPRSFNTKELNLKYDTINGGKSKFNKGPGIYQSLVLEPIKRDVKIDDLVKGRMIKPQLQQHFRVAIPQLPSPGIEVGMPAKITFSGSYTAGDYIIYAIYAKIKFDEAYMITYLERTSNA